MISFRTEKPLIPFFFCLFVAPWAHGEIRYIPLEEAENTRLCMLFSNRLTQAESDLRAATVAGGSALGKTNAEINAIRTRLKFERDYYMRKSAEACAAEEAEQQAKLDAEAQVSEPGAQAEAAESPAGSDE